MIKTAHGNPIDAGLFAPRVTTKRHGKPGGMDFSRAAAYPRVGLVRIVQLRAGDTMPNSVRCGRECRHPR